MAAARLARAGWRRSTTDWKRRGVLAA